jgi:hypothetical protein
MTTDTLCYPTWKAPYEGPFIPYHKQNPNRIALKHYNNLKYLTFMHQRGNTREKIQAAKELTICERKLQWAYNHTNFDHTQFLTEKQQIDKDWSS